MKYEKIFRLVNDTTFYSLINILQKLCPDDIDAFTAHVNAVYQALAVKAGAAYE